jgi:pyruvate formate lyase activating enzyme
MDDDRHRVLTGVTNRVILENVERAAARSSVILRIPVVPGHNDSDENVRATADFAASLGENVLRVELLPYHQLGVGMYERLGLEYPLEDVEPLGEARLEALAAMVEASGIPAQIVS